MHRGPIQTEDGSASATRRRGNHGPVARHQPLRVPPCLTDRLMHRAPRGGLLRGPSVQVLEPLERLLGAQDQPGNVSTHMVESRLPTKYVTVVRHALAYRLWYSNDRQHVHLSWAALVSSFGYLPLYLL